MEETLKMLDVYADFAENTMAVPVLKGRKTEGERFPGAVETYCIEAMMQDRKALQAGTSHFLGQNFAHACGIKFQSKDEREEYVWTTSWGVSTRLVGALIMTHADDDGMVLPPKLAPTHVVILPIFRDEETRAKVMPFVESLAAELRSKRYGGRDLEVEIDTRDLRGGEKNWGWVKKGVPLRVEVGPRDVESGSVVYARRDEPVKDKHTSTATEFVSSVTALLGSIQDTLLARAKQHRADNTVRIDSWDELVSYFAPKEGSNEPTGGFALVHWACDPAAEEKLKEHKLTVRCIPNEHDGETGSCIATGKPSPQRVVVAKAY